MAKNCRSNPRSSRKIIICYPLSRQILAQKHVFTPIFRLHTVTTGSGFRNFRNSLRNFHLLTEIYSMVPFPPSLRVGFSRYTSGLVRWTPPTRADAAGGQMPQRRSYPYRRVRGAAAPGRGVIRSPGSTGQRAAASPARTADARATHCRMSS